MAAALAGNEKLVLNSEYDLAIVTVASDGSATVPAVASKPPLPQSITPFTAESIEDAAQNVGGAKYLAVLDEESAIEETAIIASRQAEGPVRVVRATFDSVQHLIAALSVASIGFAEIQSIADSSDDVYGRHTKNPRKGEPAPRKRLGGMIAMSASDRTRLILWMKTMRALKL